MIQNIIIREMKIDDYEEIFAMWQITTKRALSRADEKESIAAYLERNKGMSYVAEIDGKIIATVLAGHDGRFGFIHHMAVMPQYRRHGIAHEMAKRSISRLAEKGIEKTHIFCYENNCTGQSFWSDFGFEKRDDLYVFSYKNSNIAEK